MEDGDSETRLTQINLPIYSPGGLSTLTDFHTVNVHYLCKPISVEKCGGGEKSWVS